MARPTNTQLAERVAILEARMTAIEGAHASLALRTASRSQVRAAFAAARSVNGEISPMRAKMEAAKQLAMELGHSVKV